MTVSVVIATYGRPDRLAACLDGLRRQTRPAEEVIVVVHASDDPSARRVAQVADRWRALRCVEVDRDGVVAAYNRGLMVAHESLVAFVDDDAIPTRDWLDRIVRTFERDGEIAAVGGRDVIFGDGDALPVPRRRSAPRVGQLQWFGRQLGNHHLGAGEPRDVDILKGVNMCFRRSAVADHGFDERLRGRGAQVHVELSICLPLRRRGGRIVYDPRIVVHHHPSPRPHGDDRVKFDREVVGAAAHNEALALFDHLPPARRAVFALWSLAIGTTHAPGLVILARSLANRRPDAWPTFVATQRGRLSAWRTRRTPRAPLGARASALAP